MPAPGQRPGGDTLATALLPEAHDRYKWVALSNTTLAVFMSALDGSIVLIALPAIFRGL